MSLLLPFSSCQSEIYFHRGNCYRKLLETRRALDDYKNAVKHDRQNATYHESSCVPFPRMACFSLSSFGLHGEVLVYEQSKHQVSRNLMSVVTPFLLEDKSFHCAFSQNATRNEDDVLSCTHLFRSFIGSFVRFSVHSFFSLSSLSTVFPHCNLTEDRGECHRKLGHFKVILTRDVRY